MDIVKIIGIGLISLIIIIIIKQYRPEFAIYVSIVAGILIITLIIDKLSRNNSNFFGAYQKKWDKFGILKYTFKNNRNSNAYRICC